MQLLDGVWQVDDLNTSHVYVIAADDGCVIIDTCVKGSAAAIVAEVRRAGYQPQQVRAIVITHAHLDHIGSVAQLQQMTSAPVWAPAGEIPAIEGRAPLPHPPLPHGIVLQVAPLLLKPEPVAVQHALHSGDSLPHLPDWRAIATPGHTPDHMSYFDPARGLLIVGDAITHVGGLRRTPWILTSNMRAAKVTVAMLAGLPIRSIGFGHGDAMIDDPTLGAQLASIARHDRYQ